jgi:uncharacterized protein DUF5916
MSPDSVCRCWASFAVIALMGTREASAQDSAPRLAQSALSRPSPATARSISVSGAASLPAVDGRLDDVAWTSAPLASDFVQQSPDPGAAATQRTEARVIVGADAIYVAMRMHDNAPDSIVGTLARRDYVGYSDWAHVILDSRRDRRTAFRFAVNPSGVKRDGFIMADSEWSEDYAWDAVWDAAVRRDSTGWTAEFRIPLSQLRFAAAAGDKGSEWGIEFQRDLARRAERTLWAPVPASGSQFVSLFGTLSGVRTSSAKRRLEFTPYAVARARSANTDPGNPLHDVRSQDAVAGADFKIGITSDLTLTGTVNPDFGQVEADPSQVNLTGGETFFAERRPFFTEGSNLFQFSLGWGEWIYGGEQLFYSRRIGRTPQLDYPDSAEFTSAAEPTRLLAAGKLSGRAFGWNVGVLSATTAQETGRYTHNAGTSRHIIEPLTHYGVYRLGRDFSEGRGSVSVIGTSTHRQLDASSVRDLHGSAFVGGVEGRRRFSRDRLSITGNLFASRVAGSTEAIAETQTSFRHLFQRDPVTMHLDSSATSLTGLSTNLQLSKNQGTWQFAVSARAATRGFDVNDLGFMNSSNLARTGGWIGRERVTPTAHTRRWASYVNWWAQSAIIGGGSLAGANWFNWVVFPNHWEVNGAIEHFFDGASQTVLRGGPVVRTSGYWLASYRLATDPRRRLSWTFDVAGSPTNPDGSRFTRATPGAVIRPAPQAEVQLQPSLEWSRNAFQFVDKPETNAGIQYLVGDLRQRTLSVTARGSYAFTANLTIQAYAQPFLSTGHFAQVGDVVAPMGRRASDRLDYLTPAASSAETVTYATSRGVITIDNPDFSIGSLNANLVVRWEYRPGSTFYAVWNQGRDDSRARGDAGFSELSRQLWSTPATHVLLVKWSHYLGR